jgi:hypothetical protein
MVDTTKPRWVTTRPGTTLPSTMSTGQYHAEADHL